MAINACLKYIIIDSRTLNPDYWWYILNCIHSIAYMRHRVYFHGEEFWPTYYPNQMLYQIGLFSKIRFSLTYLRLSNIKKDNFLSYFLFSKKFRKCLILLLAFYLIMWLMKSSKSSGKIAILEIWQLAFFWGVKTYFGILPPNWCIFRHEKNEVLQIL